MSLRLIVLLAAVGMVQAGRTLDQYIESVTGAGAVDCGTFSTIHNGMALPPRPSSKATNKVESMRESLACAAQALKDHKGFKIVQRGPSTDSAVSSGVLGNTDGVTMWFESDSDPCGGQGCAPSFYTKPCSMTDVRIVDTTRNHLFKCGD
jgi:hypothetical protein